MGPRLLNHTVVAKKLGRLVRFFPAPGDFDGVSIEIPSQCISSQVHVSVDLPEQKCGRGSFSYKQRWGSHVAQMPVMCG